MIQSPRPRPPPVLIRTRRIAWESATRLRVSGLSSGCASDRRHAGCSTEPREPTRDTFGEAPLMRRPYVLVVLLAGLPAAAPPPEQRPQPRCGARLGELEGSEGFRPAFSPDGKWVLGSGLERKPRERWMVRKWDARTRRLVATFPI